MPISLKKFKIQEDSRLGVKGKYHSKIMEFLRKNSNKAYTSAEIASILKIYVYNVSCGLNNLKRVGYVLHKSPYWTWNFKKKGGGDILPHK